MPSNKSDIRATEQRGTCPECGKVFIEPAGSHAYVSGRIRAHRRDVHGLAPRSTLHLDGETYILPQQLRDHAKQLLLMADEMEQYIVTTATARERLKEYQALVDMAKKIK